MKNKCKWEIYTHTENALKRILLIMKLSLFLSVVLTFQLTASVLSQNVNLNQNIKGQSVRDVLKLIEEKSQVRFFYNADCKQLNDIVTENVNNGQLSKMLSKLLSKSQLTYKFIENNFVVVYPTREIQNPKVSGTVTDASTGETLPGVNVVVEGTSIGVTTDVDGKFTLSLPKLGETLVFSYVGYTTKKVTVSNTDFLAVKLESNVKSLDEVVVVGYGAQKKVNLTGAIAAVKVDEKLSGRALTNVSTGLQGLLPGLAVNQNSGMAGKNDVTLLIRGLGTVNNSSPLVVVDGMPDVDINRLNLNDVENISVLKDAASSAVYGSRAANGVILITTKSGKGEGKTKINFSGNYAIESPTKSYEFMADYPRALTLEQRLAAVNTLPSNFIFKNGTVDQWLALGMIDPLRYPNTDWWKLIMRDGKVQNYNFSASGGNEKSNFFISVGTMNEKGLQINNDFDRYNGRFNFDYKLSNSMNVGAKFDGNWSKMVYALADGYTDDNPTNTAGFDLKYAISGITPYDPVTGYYGGAMAYGEDIQAYNPYTVYQNNKQRTNRQEMNPSAYFDWTPVKGLTARLDYAINYYNQFRYTADMPNTAYNFQTGSFGSRVYVGANAGVANYTNTGYKTMMSGKLNYHTIIAQHHDLSAMFVYSEEYWYDRYQMSSRNDRLYPSLHEIDAALTDIQSTGGNSSTEGLRSYVGRLNYSAFDKYLVELNFRCDGSSKFLSPHQFGFFPSAALGWRFTEENFIKPLTENWLSNGKLRLSYGSLGNNSGVGRYEQQQTLTNNPYMIAGGITKGFAYSKMVNSDLSWETTSVLNIGMDLGFLNNQLTAEIDYYDRLTTGMNRPSDMSLLLTGAYSAPRRNIGNLRNRGIEGNFTWRDKVGEVNYTVNLNATYNTTRLEKWNEYLDKGYVFLDMPYHFVYAYEASGIAQTWQDVYNATPQGASPGDILLKDINGDGRITSEDQRAYSNFQRDMPTTNYALNASFSWRGFDLEVLLQGAAGRKDFWLNDYNNTNFNSQRYAATWSHWYNPWSVENRNGAWPRIGGSGNNRYQSTFWLDDMSYLRLKNVQVGYSLPQKWVQRLHLESVRIYGSAENLATFTKYRGLDPEKSSNASDAYPLCKSYSFGINIGI